jgi:hypothetical protein
MFMFWWAKGELQKMVGDDIGTFLSRDNKGARGQQVTKKHARDSITVAMLGSMPRNAEKEEKIFFLAQGRMPGGARWIKKEEEGGSEKTCWEMPGFFSFLELWKSLFFSCNNFIFSKVITIARGVGKDIGIV